jgi:hypothetical protein
MRHRREATKLFTHIVGQRVSWPFHFRDCKSGSIRMKFFDFGVEFFFGYIKVAMALHKIIATVGVKKVFYQKKNPLLTFLNLVEKYFFT